MNTKEKALIEKIGIALALSMYWAGLAMILHFTPIQILQVWALEFAIIFALIKAGALNNILIYND